MTEAQSVHNHGPHDGPGLACPERRLQNGQLQGSCLRKREPLGTPDALDDLIRAERARQIEKGYTAERDDRQGVRLLHLWAEQYLSHGKHIEALALVRAASEARARSRAALHALSRESHADSPHGDGFVETRGEA